MNAHCRIGKVRPKLRILPKISNVQETRLMMHEYVDEMCDQYCDPEKPNNNLQAVSIVAIGFDGSHNSACFVDDNAMFDYTLLPALVADVLRRRNTRNMALQVFRGEIE